VLTREDRLSVQELFDGMSTGTARIANYMIPASVRLGMDFDQDLCHNPGHHQLTAETCSAHNNTMHSDGDSAALHPRS